MRTLVLALAVTAIAQPALARDHFDNRRSAHERSHHRLTYHHVRHHLRWSRHFRAGSAHFAGAQHDDAQPFAGAPYGGGGRAVQAQHGAFDARVSQHAQANGVPESLVHRVIVRESRYNARAVSRGNYGIMQIRLGTARAMGYTGSAAGLLDANTNMTYAVRYLAGAYRAAGGNHGRAVALYARGYYYEAKRQGRNRVCQYNHPAAPQ